MKLQEDTTLKTILRKKDFIAKGVAQRQLIQADLNNVNELLMTGPGGTGKTVALLISSLGIQKDGSLLVDRPSYRGVIVRREAIQLEKSGLISAAKEWYTKFDSKVDYNGTLKKFTFSSGAEIWFRGCEQEDSALSFKGYTKLHFVGFEELTQFTELQYDIIVSRLRDAENLIPLRSRATTNAGDKNEEWVLNRFKYWLYQDTDKSLQLNPDIKTAYGTILYSYIDINNPNMPRVITVSKPNLDIKVETIMVIATKIDDIMKDNAQTLGKINDPVLRHQLLSHVWGLKAQAGMYFKESDFREVTTIPTVATRIRYWDKAAGGSKGDYLAGLLVARTIETSLTSNEKIDRYVIEDCILVQPEVHEVKNIILNTARTDGKKVYIGIEQEGGSAGKEIAYEYEKMLRQEGFNIKIDIKSANKQTASKVSRASIISPIVKEGNVATIINLRDKEQLMYQLVSFPSGKHDDAVDSLTGSILMLKNVLPLPIINNNAQMFNPNKINMQSFQQLANSRVIWS
jgi:predicted phage terminase large subunit-like protein